MGIISLNLMNYLGRMVLSVSIISIYHIMVLSVSLYSRNLKTVTYGTESVSFIAPEIWSIVCQELKNYQL